MADLSASIPPGSAPPTDVVTRKVFINDVVLSDELTLLQVTVNKSFNKISYAKLTFADGNPADRDFVLSNDSKFKPGTPVKIQLGFHGEVETVFEGIIIKHAIKIRQQGNSILQIEAKDKAIKLTGARKSAYFVNVTDFDVMTQLAGELQKDIGSTTFSHKQLVQYDCTDWDFLLTRAEANGMLVFTDDGKIVAKKPVITPPPVLTATYGDNILEFEAEIDARRHIQEVTAQHWDFTQQQLLEAVTGTTDFADNGNITSEELGAVLGAQVKLENSGNLTQTQVQDIADAWAMRNKLAKTAGRVRVTGNAAVKPGSVIALVGVGEHFIGNVFVTGVLHHYQGGWQTDIQFGWREDWFYKKENVMDKPASGLLPGINGLHIGIVVSADDDTQVNQYRVKVHVPNITSGNEGIYARVATLTAGADYGTYFRPEANDEVILGFLNDDPREAIILGYLHSKDAHKWPFPEADKNFGFVTKAGLKMVLDETNKKITITATTASGEHTIVMNDSGAMELKDDHQNSIKMDSSGITIQSSANVTIKGSMVKIN